MTDNTVKLNQTAQIIYDAIVDLHNLEQDATRDAIRDVTGLKMTMVDDHVKTLCEKEYIRRKLPGVFVPMEIPPPARPISMTEIPGGMVKLEIGDDLFELWPREQRILGKMLTGAATQYAAIQANYEAGTMAVELLGRIKKLERELAGFKAKPDDQPQLDFTPFRDGS